MVKYLKIIIAIFFIFLITNVTAATITQYPENEMENDNSCALIRADMTIKLKSLEERLNTTIKEDGLERENRARNFIGERTNPLYQSFPVILLIIILLLSGLILKARGKI